MDEKTLLSIASRLRVAVDNNDFEELNKITAEIVDDATVKISAGCDFR
jgi:hypothetical protein